MAPGISKFLQLPRRLLARLDIRSFGGGLDPRKSAPWSSNILVGSHLFESSSARHHPRWLVSALGRPSSISMTARGPVEIGPWRSAATWSCAMTTTTRFEDRNTCRHFSTSSPSALSVLKEKAGPYWRLMRADKPIGTYLLLIPGLWSITLASAPGSLPDLTMMGLFTIGAFVMRGAGCTINDLWDKDIDKLVARTRTRPIASGEISPRQAVGFLAAQLSVGLGVLLCLNPYSIYLGAASLPFVATYPLMKRFTHYPQAFLGLTMNWGALLGFAAVSGYSNWSITIPLYLSAWSWTMIYDTLYAHQDKEDDSKIGVKSTALKFGAQTKPVLGSIALLSSGGLASAMYASDLYPAWFVGCTGLASLTSLVLQIHQTDLDSPASCAKAFLSNKYHGFSVLAALIGGALI